MKLRILALAAIALGVAGLGSAGTASAASYSGPGVAIPDSGPGAPYPSSVQVSGLEGAVADVNVTLSGVTHTCLSDLDILLLGPNSARTLLLSNAGPYTGCNGVPGTGNVGSTITLDDEALAGYPCQAAPSGSFKPTNDPTNAQGDCEPLPESFGPGVPPGPYPVSLTALDGSPASGTWQLFIVDGAGGDQGSISGWSLDLIPDETCSGRLAALASHVGTDGPDTIRGTAGADVLLGLGGKDKIKGLGGGDRICGGSGKDEISGGSGKDRLRGEGGADELKGGGGNDRCQGGKGKDEESSC